MGDSLKPFIIVCAIVSIFLVGALAAVYHKFYYPQTATVEGTATVTTYLDGELWPNETEIAWGIVSKGQTYQKLLKVDNTGDYDVTVQVIVKGLPAGWTMSWLYNNTVIPKGGWREEWLFLDVPSDAAVGNYAWDSWTVLS